ncbi:hypothetical protein [Cupriavidus nantongensis]|uniref:Uncharacterized protein n=1 Tax=Cupriavidus nantongensis TaxID=1796606 RepID=A0A142JGS1_9BURK|nr:hypothetical protein [Cupriavidus nantongensis]AMR77283.1 hypothetical protein A2G96_05800 [Cupriavidus nantongensis]
MMNNHTSQDVHYAALAFLAGQDALHADRRAMIDQAISHLQERFSMSEARAEIAVLQALGEHDSCRRQEYIDLSLSTSFLLVIVDPVSGRKRGITLATLMGLMKTPALSAEPLPSTRHLLATGQLVCSAETQH